MGSIFKATLMAPARSGDPAWVTKPTFETNWTIVKNTQVYAKKSADVDALIAALTGFRPSAPYSDKIVKSGRLSPAQIALFREIDTELSVRGLRFHHAFYALPTLPVPLHAGPIRMLSLDARCIALALVTLAAACTKKSDPVVSADPVQTARSAGASSAPAPSASASAAALASVAPSASTSASVVASDAASADAFVCPAGMAAIPGGWLVPIDDGKDEIFKGTKRTAADIPKPGAVDSFCMDKNEVTVARYRKCVDAGKCSEPYPYDKETSAIFCNWKHPDPSRDNYPINCLRGDRDDAIAFCAFDGGKTVPTDPQWEWAARGGAHLWKWPWGDTRPTEDQANLGGTKYCTSTWHVTMCGGSLPGYGAGRFDGTAPVGSLPKGDNPWGVHDLIGNVSEITSGDVPDGPRSTRSDPRIRGACYGDSYWPTVGLDSYDSMIGRDSRAGIRCVKAP